MPEKLTESSRAVVLLRKKLIAGEIDLGQNPKTIWSSDPIFMEHKLDNFRTKLNKLKTELQENQGNLLFIFFFIFFNYFLFSHTTISNRTWLQMVIILI